MKPATFPCVTSLLPANISSSGLFFYLGLAILAVELFVAGTASFSHWYVQFGFILLIIAVNHLLYRTITLLKVTGTLEFESETMKVKDQNGSLQQQITFAEIKQFHVVDSIPLTIFGFTETYKTQTAEITLVGGKTLSIECETMGKRGEESVSLKDYIHSIGL